MEGLNPGSNDRILSIGSAGDNSFSLLSKGPEAVIIYDIFLPQLHLIELKKTAFISFDYQEFISFLGFSDSQDRIQQFNKKIKSLLSSEAKEFWIHNIPLIEKGIIHGGKLESYFSLYRKYILPFMASKEDIEYFFAGPKNQSDLTAYQVKLSNPFFKLLLKIFFSKPVLRAVGRNPAFFKEVQVNISKYLFEKIAGFILDPKSYQNYYMHYIAKGQFGNTLPHYARKENFDFIKSNIHKLTMRHGNLLSAPKEEEGITLINASDIFEYIPIHEFKSFGELLNSHCPALSKIAYWNFVVDRMLSNVWPGYFNYLKDLSTTLSNHDKLFFYKRFILETVIQKR